LRKALTGTELADKDAKGQRVSSLGGKAGEGIRTLDVQLGKRTHLTLILFTTNAYGVRLHWVANLVQAGHHVARVAL